MHIEAKKTSTVFFDPHCPDQIRIVNNMVPGIKVGCTVYALAQRVMGSKRSKQRYGSTWKTKDSAVPSLQ